jgi:hypothetical protein
MNIKTNQKKIEKKKENLEKMGIERKYGKKKIEDKIVKTNEKERN